MSEPLCFLADENCDFAIVRALRAAGYDVLAVSEFMSRSDDQELIALAGREQRILLTEDKDFGWLVFVSHLKSPGVILIRFPSHSRKSLGKAIVQVVREQGDRLRGAFVVVQPGVVRISQQPN